MQNEPHRCSMRKTPVALRKTHFSQYRVILELWRPEYQFFLHWNQSYERKLRFNVRALLDDFSMISLKNSSVKGFDLVVDVQCYESNKKRVSDDKQLPKVCIALPFAIWRI